MIFREQTQFLPIIISILNAPEQCPFSVIMKVLQQPFISFRFINLVKFEVFRNRKPDFLDPAMNRRLLFKLEIRKPDPITRYLVLRDKIPSLSEQDCKILSERFELSGGQIENISRKFVMNQILNGQNYNLSQMIELCQQEYLGKSQSRNRIGFLK